MREPTSRKRKEEPDPGNARTLPGLEVSTQRNGRRSKRIASADVVRGQGRGLGSIQIITDAFRQRCVCCRQLFVWYRQRGQNMVCQLAGKAVV